ncbi:MAG TPA: DUF6624 domain-containing protein [Gaiellales bacterium]|nr:DUF6624 domain-containing protein [Gaiellales bacterium]
MIELFLREELLTMAAEDGAVRERLVADGTLFDGYNPLMAIVHRRNGDRLSEIVDAHGWPGRSLVGEDGADAAWLLLHHAIGDPALQRRCLPLLDEAAAFGDVPPWHPATLLDGIRFHEGRPQVYGTVFDWQDGVLAPWEIEEPEDVDERRALVGLPSLAEQSASVRQAAEEEGDLPPADPAARRAQAVAWARSVGWRT